MSEDHSLENEKMIKWLLGLSSKTPADDISRTYYNTFGKLLKASKDPELLTRSFAMSTALTACGAALREVHGLPFEEDSTAMHYAEALSKGDYALIKGLDGSLMEGLKMSTDWPDRRKRRWIALKLHPKYVKKWEEKWKRNYQ